MNRLSSTKSVSSNPPMHPAELPICGNHCRRCPRPRRCRCPRPKGRRCPSPTSRDRGPTSRDRGPGNRDRGPGNRDGAPGSRNWGFQTAAQPGRCPESSRGATCGRHRTGRPHRRFRGRLRWTQMKSLSDAFLAPPEAKSSEQNESAMDRSRKETRLRRRICGHA